MTIRAVQVSYTYARRPALRSVSLECGQGATLLLGPNGAGKSTLLEIFASLRRPRPGIVEIDGIGSPGPSAAALKRYRSAIAWLPQKFVPYPGVNVREHVALAGWLKGMTKREAWSGSRAALGCVGLLERADDTVRSLSGGQARRLGIAGALIHDARVVLLDEPTASLDPAQRRRFRDVIAGVAETRTVIISSHETQDALEDYRSIVVMRSGTVRFAGTPGEFVGATDAALGTAERMRQAYEAVSGAPE
jgi:ABC-type multidrug transport system ATPase subunit